MSSKSKRSKKDSQLFVSSDVNDILYARTANPHAILGKHPCDGGYVYRAFDPAADKIDLVIAETCFSMKKVDENGFFVAFIDSPTSEAYKYKKHYGSTICESEDSYSFLPTVSDFDLHLFSTSEHRELYNLLGSRLIDVDGVSGTRFTLWAPNAIRVSLIGNFNNWDGRRHLMRTLGDCGIWELFVPGLGSGEYYKYELCDNQNHIFIKQDPLSLQYERRPGTASVVTPDINFDWQDEGWMSKREVSDPLKLPLSIYEVHLDSWNGPGLPEKSQDGFHNYRDLAKALCTYVKDLGFTHVELLPVTEHPLDQSWGYQTTGYFAATSRFGSTEDFAFFVDYFHQQDIGVIIDWAPAHFPKDACALGRFDGSALYEHLDPRLGEHQDWGTFIFNYSRNEVANFLVSSALFWLKEYHIDGLRVDAVSSMLYLDYSREGDEWVPNEYGGNENLAAIDFIKKLNLLSHDLHPGSMIIAEESTAYPKVSKPIFDGGLGYTMKWNMGWMHDFLDYFGQECVHRQHHQNQITFSLTYAFNENFILPLSHDEVVHGKGSLITRMPGDIWQKFANLRSLFGVMFAHPGRKLLFMGSELAQWREWDSDGSLDWPTLSNPLHFGIQQLIKGLNKVYKENPCFFDNDHQQESFAWIDFSDSEQSVLSFMRYSKDKEDQVLCIFNLTPVVRDNYRIGVPQNGQWQMILNTDDSCYGGTDYLPEEVFESYEPGFHGQQQHICLNLPPLSVLYLKPKS